MIVHFVIAMVFFSFFCDVVGYFTRNVHLFEVGFWNIFVAAIAIFVAIIFGQFEAGLAQVYPAAQPTLNFHTVMGWSLGVLLRLQLGVTEEIERMLKDASKELSDSKTCIVKRLIIDEIALGKGKGKPLESKELRS